MKDVAIIKYKEKMIFVNSIRRVDSVEYLKLEEEAKKNLDELLQDYEDCKKKISTLEKQIELLTQEVKILKGEE